MSFSLRVAVVESAWPFLACDFAFSLSGVPSFASGFGGTASMRESVLCEPNLATPRKGYAETHFGLLLHDLLEPSLVWIFVAEERAHAAAPFRSHLGEEALRIGHPIDIGLFWSERACWGSSFPAASVRASRGFRPDGGRSGHNGRRCRHRAEKLCRWFHERAPFNRLVVQSRLGEVKTIFRDASTLPYSSSVSYFTVTVNVSLLPASFRSFGTRHEYPQVPSQPKGIGPSATFLPAESVIVTIGSSERRRSYGAFLSIAVLDRLLLLPRCIVQAADHDVEHRIDQNGLDLDFVARLEGLVLGGAGEEDRGLVGEIQHKRLVLANLDEVGPGPVPTSRGRPSE